MVRTFAKNSNRKGSKAGLEIPSDWQKKRGKTNDYIGERGKISEPGREEEK